MHSMLCAPTAARMNKFGLILRHIAFFLFPVPFLLGFAIEYRGQWTAYVGLCRYSRARIGGGRAGCGSKKPLILPPRPHPNIQEVGSSIGLFSLSASAPLTFRIRDQITHQISTTTPITGKAYARRAPTTR
jgi:hypothetical protein